MKKKAFHSEEKECPHCKKILTIEVDRITTNPTYKVNISSVQGNLYPGEKPKDMKIAVKPEKATKKPLKKDKGKK